MISIFDINLTKILRSFKNKNYKFILGLSGGIDSMVLLHLLKNFINNNQNLGINLIPVIIDHNLRNESEKEAMEVKKIAQSLGFNPQIKKIEVEKPNGNIQNWARRHRRNFLFEICTDLSANLILAHHFDDQIETLFMRMIKETGLDGLSGMNNISTWNGIFILRPLLFFKKQDIENFAKKNQIRYFEDTSNFNFEYERVKTRFYLKLLKKNIWPNITNDLNYLNKLSNNLLKKTNFIFDNWAKKNILINEGGAVRISYKSLENISNKSCLYSVRIIGKIIQTVGGNEYPPKRKKTSELLSSIFLKQFKSKSLGNVTISLHKGHFFFIRENRNVNYKVNFKKNKYFIFDGRFLAISSISGKLINNHSSNLMIIDPKNPFHEHDNLINRTIPCLQTLEGETIRPHLSIIKKNPPINHKEDSHFSLYLLNRILV